MCFFWFCLPGLWGLVNNAGIWYLSEIEMTPEKIWRQVLEVNLFGMIRVTKAFLPLIRQAKGRVINMSSVSGRSFSKIFI
jgi:NAD(P)-dependent dehydrogenase (short-subunit alcohol dehydrogenase family)